MKIRIVSSALFLLFLSVICAGSAFAGPCGGLEGPYWTIVKPGQVAAEVCTNICQEKLFRCRGDFVPGHTCHMETDPSPNGKVDREIYLGFHCEYGNL